MTTIIDGDSLVWKCCYYIEALQSFNQSVDNMNEHIHEFLKVAGTTHYVGFLGESPIPTFRRKLFSEYKAKRPEKPRYYTDNWELVYDILVNKWKFNRLSGLECDDAVAIQAAHYRKIERPYTIIGVDKDLLQIEGTHYNPDKKQMQYISYDTAQYNLYKQILTGDQTDNIKGLAGIGPVKATKILTEAPSNHKREWLTLAAYQGQLGDNKGLEEFCKNSLLVMLKESEEGYTIPEEVEYST